MSTFDEVAQNPNFTFIGNTSVGTFITPGSPKATLEISDLQPHYDAILLAYGAHEDRLLGIPNEQSLQGVMAARSFKTDLTDKMIKILENSRVKHVHVIGRRGPLEIQPTTFHMDEALLASAMERAGKTLDRPRKRLMGLLEKGIKEPKPNHPKSCSESKGDLGHRKAVATGEMETLECRLAFRSIGYKSVGILGVPFDERKGIVPNMDARLFVPDQTGDTIVADWTGGQAMLNNDQEVPKDQRSTNPVLDLLHSRGHKTVSYADWKKIEQKEFELGAKVGKPRETFLSVEEMLNVLD
ncbi:hypothetical protein B0O80DRAFT_495482 [Mortierella sp. GBAus27b]|nr:hypothetical protein B0O80DRAFT_495482 [Mortierella sp. GBAus27b]